MVPTRSDNGFLGDDNTKRYGDVVGAVISFFRDWHVNDNQGVLVFNGNTRHFFRIERCSKVGNINIEGVSDFE